MFTTKKNPYVLILLGLLLITLCACSKSVTPPEPEITPEEPPKEAPKVEAKKTDAEIFWEKYVRTADTKMKPFRTQLSMRYGVDGKTDRANALLWGNSVEEMRLDISAGVGVTVAKIYEGPRQFVIFMPQEKKAYRLVGAEKPLFTIGVPMPLGLAHLTLLLNGQSAKVFGEEYSAPLKPKEAEIPQDILEELPKNAEAYTLTNPSFTGTLVLDVKGLPLYWQAADSKSWNIEFNYKEKQTLPFRLTITHAESKRKALLVIKERESGVKPFTGVKLKLILPTNTPIAPLEELGKEK